MELWRGISMVKQNIVVTRNILLMHEEKQS